MTRRAASFKRNDKGGILIEKNDLKKLFGFLDVDKKKNLTESDLRSRLSIFYKSGRSDNCKSSAKEYKFLMNNRSTMSIDDLHNILMNNELVNFDPIQESFNQIFDPNDSGFLDVNILKNIMINFGYKHISDKDIEILVKIMDQDQDGKVNLFDFRNLIKNSDNPNDELSNQSINTII